MTTTHKIVESYLLAIGERDLETARGYLSDVNFTYKSPIGSYDNADSFIDSLFGIGPIIEKLKIRRLFSSGDEALGVIDTLTTLDGYNTRTCAIWFEIQGGKIIAMEAIFDASMYKEMFAEQFKN